MFAICLARHNRTKLPLVPLFLTQFIFTFVGFGIIVELSGSVHKFTVLDTLVLALDPGLLPRICNDRTENTHTHQDADSVEFAGKCGRMRVRLLLRCTTQLTVFESFFKVHLGVNGQEGGKQNR